MTIKFSKLREKATSLGKPNWRAMLAYLVELHEKSIHQACAPFQFAWEDTGSGYCSSPAFGHWDIVHAVLDVMLSEPQHARQQILNNLAAQQEDGFLPGLIYMHDNSPKWSTTAGHPPVWPLAVQDYADHFGNAIISECYHPLIRQIRWFENNRQAKPNGFFYTDILTHRWESGVDESIRFLDVQTGPFACIDATSHVFAMYKAAASWSRLLGKAPDEFELKADQLRVFIQNELFSEKSVFFHDVWAIQDSDKRCLSFEGVWPVVVGAAKPEQARRVIHENLLNSRRFFSFHPITTVAQDDSRFELRMWRGPVWNSMTYWAARGCLGYGFHDAAKILLEKALDASALQFEKTGTIWEFYHPHGGRQEEMRRKPQTEFNTPCRDYLGHNPLIAMAEIYSKVAGNESC